MKKWLIAEAVLFTIIPVCLAIYSLPLLIFSAGEALFPIENDYRSFSLRIFGLLPYFGGIYGIFMVWRLAMAAAFLKKIFITWKIILALLGGAAATWEITRTTNWFSASVVCLPVWILVIHLLVINLSTCKLNSETQHP